MNVTAGILSAVGAAIGGGVGFAVARRKGKETRLHSSLIGGAIGALVLGSFAPSAAAPPKLASG